MRRLADIDWAAWQPTDRATLLFVVDGERVLLIRKQRGLGAGKINAPGGRLEPGESPRAAAIREVEEEVGVTPTDVTAHGALSFQFVDGYGLHVHVFVGRGFRGEPRETPEAIPHWFSRDRIPYDEMWADDRVWLPEVLAGRSVSGRFVFDGDAMLDHAVTVAPAFAEWSPQHKLVETLAAPLGAHVPAPDLQVIERPGWYQLVRPSAPDSHNEVVVACLAEADADRVIDETIAQYRELGLAFKWIVGPGTEPSDLGERLVRRGFEEWGARGMCCDTALELSAPEDVAVELVDERSLDAFARTMAAGWGADPELFASDTQRMLASGRHACFVARRSGRAVGAASSLRHARSSYLLGAVVLPEARGTGAYRALLAARLAHAAESGATLATTHAREATSAPILERLGFESVCRFRVFRSRA